jgi:dipeptidyl aminopeptidase/acylaminoacyl peptidase
MSPRRWAQVVAGIALTLAGAVALRRVPSTDEVARVRRQVAASSSYFGILDVPVGGAWIALATESGVPGIFVTPTNGELRPKELAASQFWSRPSVSPDGRFVVAESIPAKDAPGDPPLSLRLYDIATAKGEELVAARPGQDLRDVSWSPDSRRILYRRTQKGPGEGASASSFQILEVATRTEETVATFPFAVRSPTWLPDGSGIVFYRGDGPDLWRVDGSGKEPRRITAFPADAIAAPERPAFSPDGKTIAIALSTPKECNRIQLVDLESGAFRPAFADECAIFPQWFPSGDELAFLRLGDATRTLWARRIAGGEARLLGFDDGMTYSHGFASDGSLLFVGGPSDYPRSVWRAAPNGPSARPRLATSMFNPPLDRRWVSKPERVSIESTDNLQIPIVVFPRSCGDRDRPGPAVVWVHHENDFVSEQWGKEVQFVALSGATVFAVNYRGSNGYGPHLASFKDDAAGKVDDVVAAIAYAARRPDVDKQKLFLMHDSSGSPVGWGATLRSEGKLRGVIDLVGVPWPTLLRSEVALPPMVWISGLADPITPTRRGMADWLQSRTLVTWEEYEGGHSSRMASSNARILDAVERFITKTMDVPSCTAEMTAAQR